MNLVKKLQVKKSNNYFNNFSKKFLSNQYEKRNPIYSTLSDKDVNFFEKLIGGHRCITDPNDLEAYNTDWLKICKGNSKLTLLPKTTEQMSAILKYCNEKKLAVCPQGGNTGLVGGSVPVYDEIIISTKLMNNILDLDKNSNVLKCQSGCVLQNLDDFLNQSAGLMMPLDLGAKGSCHIGGNVSTNAGGLRLLRYGSLKGNVLGLEVVLANGDVLNTMKTSLRKDNTGYDLNQMFIGSEGTLGFITGVSILCPNKPKSTNLILIACENKSFKNVIDVFKLAKVELNEILSAFEFMDKESMIALSENLGLENPFKAANLQVAKDCVFYCLAETHGSCQEHDLNKIEKFYDTLKSAKLCSDAIIAENESQFGFIWSLRERLPESLRRDGYNYKYDISLPLNNMYDLVIDMRKRLNEYNKKLHTRCIGYGHCGDSNLHLNITSPVYDENLFSLLEPFIYEWTKHNNGSISAEHGLGLKKRNYIYHSKSIESVKLMQKFKKLLDPNLILNPYKTLPPF
jgi:D-2-hydroxyglutarate dehydrogenase